MQAQLISVLEATLIYRSRPGTREWIVLQSCEHVGVQSESDRDI